MVDTAVMRSSTDTAVPTGPLPTQVYDRATVTGIQSSGFEPKGSVGFTLYGSRSEERRVGKTCRRLSSPCARNKKVKGMTASDPVSTNSNTTAKRHAAVLAYPPAYS